ncbi:MAG: hypothetical protein GEV05_24995 [Betaproteobacteria bacterium]|nr:hypothetical protein [Betaproteobacteria bacterium]
MTAPSSSPHWVSIATSTLSPTKADPGQAWRLFLTTGILGGFTTFSAFSLDVTFLYERGEIAMTAVYVLASAGVSVAALFTGLFLMRTL